MDSKGNTDVLVFIRQAYRGFLARNIYQKIVWVIFLLLAVYLFFTTKSRDPQIIFVIFAAVILDRVLSMKSPPAPGSTSQQQGMLNRNEPQFNAVWNGAKLGLILLPVGIILFIAPYLYFKNSLSQNGYLVILIPLAGTALIAIIFNIFKRNDPNWIGYYIFHLSKTGRIVLLIGAVLMIISYFYSQCSNFSQPFGLSCIRGILDGSLANKERMLLHH